MVLNEIVVNATSTFCKHPSISPVTKMIRYPVFLRIFPTNFQVIIFHNTFIWGSVPFEQTHGQAHNQNICTVDLTIVHDTLSFYKADNALHVHLATNFEIL